MKTLGLTDRLVAYIDQGSGPALLLIHAFPLDHTMWQAQIGHLSGRFRVIAPDVRGFGGSSPTLPWTIHDMCEELRTLLDSLNIETCTVMGLSMGGYIALPFYAQHPIRVRQLILANTRARSDNDAEKTARTELIAALERDGASMLAERMLPRLLRPDPDSAVVKSVRSTILRADPVAAIHALQAMRGRADSSNVLGRIACPSLIIAGDEDAITNIEECRAMAAAVPEGRFASIPHAGHLTNLENPGAFNAALDEFLGRTTRSD